MLDTGANISVVTPQTVQQLELSVVTLQSPVTIQMADSSIVEIQSVVSLGPILGTAVIIPEATTNLIIPLI